MLRFPVLAAVAAAALASAAGTTWQVTRLSGSIAAGGDYLVQEAAGAGGTTPLPSPNATGSIAMSATSGKVALVLDHILLSRDLSRKHFDYDVVHVNSEFADQASDHEPQVVRLSP